jgi:hypothetical protein
MKARLSSLSDGSAGTLEAAIKRSAVLFLRLKSVLVLIVAADVMRVTFCARSERLESLAHFNRASNRECLCAFWVSDSAGLAAPGVGSSG